MYTFVKVSAQRALTASRATADTIVDMIRERSATGISVTFHGAAQTVTGSMHLLETPDARILLDCGLMLGHRDDVHARNRQFPFPPSYIDAVLLSHAHIDHCGNLPNLVRQGFSGPIY